MKIPESIYQSQENSARLFMASTNETDALCWRLKLVEDRGICDSEKLATFLTEASLDLADSEEINDFIEWAKSDLILLDEIEVAQIYTAHSINTILNAADSDNLIANLSISIRLKAAVDNLSLTELSKDPNIIQKAKSDLKKSYDVYLNNQIADIRAKLAFQELIATIAPTKIIPSLISQSPRYLMCPNVQKWILYQQSNLKSTKKKVRLAAQLSLESISKSLIGSTKAQRRKHPFFFTLIQYDSITLTLKKFYSDFVVNNLGDKKILILFCEQRNMKPADLISRLKTTRGRGFRQVAIDILENNMGLVEAKALSHIQEKMAKLRKKHPNFAAKMPEIMHFADFINENPLFLKTLSDYMSVTEKVQLVQRPPQ